MNARLLVVGLMVIPVGLWIYAGVGLFRAELENKRRMGRWFK